MNWNGGKLQRHAKANSNQQRKAQKQYFAKARQRLQRGPTPVSPPALAHYHDPRPSPAQKTYQVVPINPQLQSYLAHDLPSPAADNADDSGETRPSVTSCNSLESVKRRLLNKSDWAGISAARPVQMFFAPSSEMQRIGRRKRIGKKSQHTVHTGAMDKRYCRNENRLRAMPQIRSSLYQPDLHTDDYSIRIGSNIHRVQTTIRDSPEAAVVLDPMLIERGGHQLQRGIATAEEVYLEPGQNPAQAQVDEDLLPLNKALDLKSFDDVKNRSSSMVRQVSTGSNPFAVHNSPMHTSQGGMVSSTRPPTGSGLQERRPEERVWSRHVYQYCDEQNLQAPTKSRAGTEAIRDGTSRWSKVNLASTSPDLSTPHFTIDHQVLLERQLKANTESLPSSQHTKPRPPRPIHMNGPRIDGTPLHPDPSVLKLRGGKSTYSTSEVDEPAFKRQRVDSSNHATWHASLPADSRSAPGMSPRSEIGVEVLKDSSSWRNQFQLAKRDHKPLRKSAEELSKDNASGTNSISDENEAWMRYVFPRDFGRIQCEFSFGSPHPALKPSLKMNISNYRPLPPQWQSEEGYSTPSPRHRFAEMASQTSIPTNVNTSLAQSYVVPTMHQSEIDFLSQLSPMEGLLDDRLGPISTYTNAARSEQNYIQLPSRPTNSVSDQPLSTPSHRKALHPLPQPILWQSQIDHSPKVSGPLTPADRPNFTSPLWNTKASRLIDSTSETAPPHLFKAPMSPLPTQKSATRSLYHESPSRWPLYSSLLPAAGYWPRVNTRIGTPHVPNRKMKRSHNLPARGFGPPMGQ